MEKKFNVQVINPANETVIYEVEIRFTSEIKENECSGFKTITGGGHKVSIIARNKKELQLLLVRVAEELTEDVFYSTFDEYNNASTTLQKMEMDIEDRFGITVDAIKSNIRYQILDGCGAFEEFEKFLNKK